MKEKEKLNDYLEVSKSGEQLRLKDLKSERGDKRLNKSQSSKVLSRKIRFGDCIGLIHYCRLCYKFACLLDEMEESGTCEQNKMFLGSWAVQLL